SPEQWPHRMLPVLTFSLCPEKRDRVIRCVVVEDQRQSALAEAEPGVFPAFFYVLIFNAVVIVILNQPCEFRLRLRRHLRLRAEAYALAELDPPEPAGFTKASSQFIAVLSHLALGLVR